MSVAYVADERIRQLLRADSLRCLQCGHDLRAQDGAARRCPGCDYVTDIASLDRLVFGDLTIGRRLRVASNLAVVPPVVSVIGLIVVLIPPETAVAVVVLLSILAVWGGCVVGFGTATRFLPGWRAAFGWYALISTIVLLMIVIGITLALIILLSAGSAIDSSPLFSDSEKSKAIWKLIWSTAGLLVMLAGADKARKSSRAPYKVGRFSILGRGRARLAHIQAMMNTQDANPKNR